VLAFQHNIRFPDEPDLTDSVDDDTLESIVVSRCDTDDSTPWCKTRSAWAEMSGCKVRYLTDQNFDEYPLGCRWGLEVERLGRFSWLNGSYGITYQPYQEFTAGRLQFWVLHTLLPMILALQQRFQILHVASVEIDNQPVAFAAPSFGGKSTLTGYFIRRRHPFLSDDTLGIEWRDGKFHAVASYPFHRAFRAPESLGVPVELVARKPQPLKAIYFLRRREAEAEVKIAGVTGIRKFKAFHFSSFINFDFLKRPRFEFLGAMAASVPAYEIEIPWDLDRLGEVHDQIVRHSLTV